MIESFLSLANWLISVSYTHLLGGSGSRGYGKVAFENLKATTVFGNYDVKTLNELLTAEV